MGREPGYNPSPGATILRAVGPNLVVCLLLDGPQSKERWSTRAAAALADDPGSSVLTLTSLGMLRRAEEAYCSRTRVSLPVDHPYRNLEGVRKGGPRALPSRRKARPYPKLYVPK